MLPVQQFLLNNSFASLYAAHGVSARPSKDNSKWSLNYDQLVAKPNDLLANQCRGLILRPTNSLSSDSEVVGETVVLARPMDRFFNAGDPAAAPIDWSDSTVRIEDKLDGTCCILYFDHVKQEWHVATRAVPEADVSFGNDIASPLKENTFRQLFEYAVEQNYYASMPRLSVFYSWCCTLDKSLTYVYELTSPLNRIVVKYNEYRITLLNVRVTATGKYVDPRSPDLDDAVLFLPHQWPLQTLEDLTNFVESSDPAKMEGAVIVDGDFNRVKVKSKAWILASRSKDVVSMSKRGALRAIIDGTIGNIRPLLDNNLREYLISLELRYLLYCTELGVSFHDFKSEPDRKAFALRVQASGHWPTPFFQLITGKYPTVQDWLKKMCKTDKITDTMLDTILKEIDK